MIIFVAFWAVIFGSLGYNYLPFCVIDTGGRPFLVIFNVFVGNEGVGGNGGGGGGGGGAAEGKGGGGGMADFSGKFEIRD